MSDVLEQAQRTDPSRPGLDRRAVGQIRARARSRLAWGPASLGELLRSLSLRPPRYVPEVTELAPHGAVLRTEFNHAHRNGQSLALGGAPQTPGSWRDDGRGKNQ